MTGTLEATFDKGGRTCRRRLNPDRTFTAPDGSALTLPGRSLLLIRNVGIHMETDAVTTADGRPIPEGFLDAMVTGAGGAPRPQGARAGTATAGPAACTSSSRSSTAPTRSPRPSRSSAASRTRSGWRGTRSRSASWTRSGGPRSTSPSASARPRERVVFINTGFLDRTGDEIHTSMEAGPMIPKMEIKNTPWMLAYEDWNVDVGIAAGLPGRAQIGKGMWTMPDRMRAMVEAKVAHPAPAPAPRGSPRRRPRRSTRCTTTRSTSPPARPSWRAARGPPRRHPHPPLARRPDPLRRGDRARAREQRAGDPRLRRPLGRAGASAARRSPTSTTSA